MVPTPAQLGCHQPDSGQHAITPSRCRRRTPGRHAGRVPQRPGDQHLARRDRREPSLHHLATGQPGAGDIAGVVTGAGQHPPAHVTRTTVKSPATETARSSVIGHRSSVIGHRSSVIETLASSPATRRTVTGGRSRPHHVGAVRFRRHRCRSRTRPVRGGPPATAGPPESAGRHSRLTTTSGSAPTPSAARTVIRPRSCPACRAALGTVVPQGHHRPRWCRRARHHRHPDGEQSGHRHVRWVRHGDHDRPYQVGQQQPPPVKLPHRGRGPQGHRPREAEPKMGGCHHPSIRGVMDRG